MTSRRSFCSEGDRSIAPSRSSRAMSAGRSERLGIENPHSTRGLARQPCPRSPRAAELRVSSGHVTPCSNHAIRQRRFRVTNRLGIGRRRSAAADSSHPPDRFDARQNPCLDLDLWKHDADRQLSCRRRPLQQFGTELSRAVVVCVEKDQHSGGSGARSDRLRYRSFQFAGAHDLAALHTEGAPHIDMRKLEKQDRSSQQNADCVRLRLTLHDGDEHSGQCVYQLSSVEVATGPNSRSCLAA